MTFKLLIQTYLIFTILLATFSSEAALDHVTTFDDLQHSTANEMNAELSLLIGVEDSWKVPFYSKLFNSIFSNGGLFSSYRQSGFFLPESKKEESLEVRRSKYNALLKREAEKYFKEAKLILQLSDAKILEIYSRFFTMTKSPLNNIVTTIQSEKRMIIEDIIRSNLTKFKSRKIDALKHAIIFSRNIQNGVIADESSSRYLSNAVGKFGINFSLRSESSISHSLPLFLEFEKAALDIKISPITVSIFDSLQQFSSRNVETKNGGILLIISPQNVSDVSKYILKITRELSGKIEQYSKVAFKNDYTQSTERDWIVNRRHDDSTEQAQKIIADLWLSGGEKLSSISFNPDNVASFSCETIFAK